MKPYDLQAQQQALINQYQGQTTLPQDTYLDPTQLKGLGTLSSQLQGIASGSVVEAPKDLGKYVESFITDRKPFYQMPQQRSTADIQRELTGLMGTTQADRNVAMSNALARFGAAMQTPGLSLAQAFGYAAPQFTQVMTDFKEKERAKREALALQARRESLALQEQARVANNALAGKAMDSFTAKQMAELNAQAAGRETALKTVMELAEEKAKEREYEIVPVFDNNAPTDAEKLQSLTKGAYDAQGNFYAMVQGQYYTSEELAKHGFNFIPDEKGQFAKEYFNNIGRTAIDRSTATTITMEQNGELKTIPARQLDNGIVVRPDFDAESGYAVVNPMDFYNGKRSEVVENVERNNFRSVDVVKETVGNIPAGSYMFDINKGNLPAQRTDSKGNLKNNVLHADDFFVTVQEPESSRHIRSGDGDDLKFYNNKLQQNQELETMLVEFLGKRDNFVGVPADYAFGFKNVLARSGPTRFASTIAAGFFDVDMLDFELSDQGKRDVTKIQRKLAIAWMESPRFAMTERSALIGIVDGAVERGEDPVPLIQQYFNREANSINGIRDILVTTRNNVENYGAHFREKEEGRLRQHRIPTGSSTNPFVLGGEISNIVDNRNADGTFSGNSALDFNFNGNSKLDLDGLRYLDSLYNTPKISKAQQSKILQKQFAVGGALHAQIVRATQGKEIPIPTEPVTYTYDQLRKIGFM